MIDKRRTTLLIGLMFLGLAVVLWARPDAGRSAPGAAATPFRLVQVAPVERIEAGREARLPGVTRAARRAALAFTISARVAQRPVEVGDRVRAGQLLARLDGDEFLFAERSSQAALAELEVRLAQARRDEARVASLAATHAATAEELEQVRAVAGASQAAHDAARARLDNAARLLRETELRAPFAGTVTAVRLEPGEWASPGATAVELAGSGALEIRVEVPESIQAGIATGAPVRVELPRIGRTVAGRVGSVADAAPGAGSLFPVVIEVDAEPGLVAGLSAEVFLPLESGAALTVPLGAVLDSGSSRPSVFRIVDGIARRVAIEPGDLIGERLIVRSTDLAEGDLVAVVGQTALVDGDRVEVR